MLDYNSIFAAADRVVPNLRDQLVQDAVLKMQQQQFDAVQQQRQAQAQAAQQQAEQEAAFQRDLEQAMLTGDPRQILALRMRYPDLAKGMKDAFDSLDEDERRRNLTQIGTIYARGQAGDFAGAAGELRRRIEADQASGMADPQDLAMLEELESGIPARQKAALAAVGIQLAAIEPDKFGETYAKLNPSERIDPTQREYEWRAAQFGRAAANAWLQTQDTKLVPVTQGGTVFQVGGDTVPMDGFGGGIVATPGQQAESERMRQMFPNAPEFGPETQRGGDPSGLGAGAPAPAIPGNLPLDIRYQVKNQDGTVSTVRTISIGTNQGEVLIPTVVGGRVVSDDEAIAHYERTGENFGTFRTPSEATAFAEKLHQYHQGALSGGGSGAAGLTPEQFRANAEVLGAERAAAMTARNGIPVRVRSVQEAERLPPGTLYETPTGERYTR